ncbi:MAG: hypothetical protein AAF942_12540, partial [Pseudomonadota bacterium]
GDYDPPPGDWPLLHSRLPPLDGKPKIELFLADTVSGRLQDRGFDILMTRDLMFGGCRIEETPDASIEDISDQAYDALFRIVGDHGYPHILRLWNVVEDINADLDGLERYRHFCIGRQNAFDRLRPDLIDRYPAASALGSTEGGLNLYVVAAREPGLPIENPQQVSAFRYPPQYGPRSPSFSRALLKTWGENARLFISGTASITGHETRHIGDLDAQVEQTIDNLEILAREASDRFGKPVPLRSPGSYLKAYVRRPEDFEAVKGIVERRLGNEVNTIYLRADICREALLVEIEGLLSA